MKTFNCLKCPSKEVFIEQVGNNTGLYCADCGKWIKWLNKEDHRLAKRYIEEMKLVKES
jgi:transcription elongation factor Elf1